jgi:SH3-like domain-containing protein
MALRSLILLFLSGLCLLAAPSHAQEREVPYWAAIRAEQVNMRKGPSLNYPIDWVYRRPGLPVKVVRVMQGWRLIQDPDGTQGWVAGRLLTLERGAIVVGAEIAPIREEPDDQSELMWSAEPGVVGRLGDCREGWCEIDVEGRAGWIAQERIWGAGEP